MLNQELKQTLVKKYNTEEALYGIDVDNASDEQRAKWVTDKEVILKRIIAVNKENVALRKVVRQTFLNDHKGILPAITAPEQIKGPAQKWPDCKAFKTEHRNRNLSWKNPCPEGEEKETFLNAYKIKMTTLATDWANDRKWYKHDQDLQRYTIDAKSELADMVLWVAYQKKQDRMKACAAIHSATEDDTYCTTNVGLPEKPAIDETNEPLWKELIRTTQESVISSQNACNKFTEVLEAKSSLEKEPTELPPKDLINSIEDVDNSTTYQEPAGKVSGHEHTHHSEMRNKKFDCLKHLNIELRGLKNYYDGEFFNAPSNPELKQRVEQTLTLMATNQRELQLETNLLQKDQLIKAGKLYDALETKDAESLKHASGIWDNVLKYVQNEIEKGDIKLKVIESDVEVDIDNAEIECGKKLLDISTHEDERTAVESQFNNAEYAYNDIATATNDLYVQQLKDSATHSANYKNAKLDLAAAQNDFEVNTVLYKKAVKKEKNADAVHKKCLAQNAELTYKQKATLVDAFKDINVVLQKVLTTYTTVDDLATAFFTANLLTAASTSLADQTDLLTALESVTPEVDDVAQVSTVCDVLVTSVNDMMLSYVTISSDETFAALITESLKPDDADPAKDLSAKVDALVQYLNHEDNLEAVKALDEEFDKIYLEVTNIKKAMVVETVDGCLNKLVTAKAAATTDEKAAYDTAISSLQTVFNNNLGGPIQLLMLRKSGHQLKFIEQAIETDNAAKEADLITKTTADAEYDPATHVWDTNPGETDQDYKDLKEAYTTAFNAFDESVNAISQLEVED